MLMMLPFEAPTIFEQINKSWFRMPRVVKDQRNKFDNDDLFRQLSHESAVKYTGFKDRPLEERQMKFIANCQEGHTEVSVVQSGNQFTLMFNPTANPAYNNEGCDFDKELGKVHIKSGFILNGVCVLWRGWIDLQRLEGFGCLEFDEYRAYLEDAMLKQQIEKQQTCNSGPANHHSSPLSRFNHHPGANHPLGALNPMGPAGLNPCLGGLVPSGVGGPPSGPHPGLTGQTATSLPPVSLADSAAHYGTAAIAAAAAAFHQAFGAAGPGGQAPAGLSGPPSSVNAAAAAAAATASQHLPYTNGISMTNGSASSISNSGLTPARGSPSSQNNGSTRSPEREQQQQHQHHHNQHSHHQHSQHRQSLKRAPEEQTQLDDVDVVSDIQAHDLDFPPRRIFKSELLTTAGHHHHRSSRRAA